MEDKKKRVAAVSAVMEYIQKEENQESRQVLPPAEFSNANNLWGIGGRQAQMQLRTMMLLKAFHGLKVR